MTDPGQHSRRQDPRPPYPPQQYDHHYAQQQYPQQQYPQQQYPQQGYAGTYATGYGQPYAPPPRGMSITSLVLGLVSIFAGFTLLVPIVGLVFGILGVKREPAGKGMAIAGLILNGLTLVGWILLAILVLFVGGMFAASYPSGVPA